MFTVCYKKLFCVVIGATKENTGPNWYIPNICIYLGKTSAKTAAEYHTVYGTLLHPRMHSIPGYRKAFGSNLQHHLVSMRSDLTINKLASLCLVGSTPECDYHVHTCTNKFHQVGKLTFNLNGHSTAVRKHPKIGQTYISKLMDQNSENERCL